MIDEPDDSAMPEKAQDAESDREDSEVLPLPSAAADKAVSQRPGSEAIDFLADVPLQVEIRLGGAQLSIGELLALGPGAVVTLERRADDPVEVVAGGRVIARGEMVVVDDRLGVRITELCASEGEARE
ncbi:MAG: flagellar motor switch protein FliN [Armatimonadota bacterium]